MMATKDKDNKDKKEGVKKMKKQHYSDDIKKDVCRRLCQGEPPLKIAEETGINKNTIYYWQNNCSFMDEYKNKYGGSRDEYCKSLEEMIERLQKENADLRSENEVLRKAFQLLSGKAWNQI